MVFHRILEGIASSEANMVIGEGVAKRDRSLLAHHMIARCDQHQSVFGKRKGLKFFGGIDLVADDADVGEASGDGAHDVGLERSSRSMSICGCCDKKVAKAAGRELGGCSRIGQQAYAPAETVGIL
jgi:hypothetical protein